MIDSHAHLAMVAPGDVTAVLDRAAAAGVRGVLVPATGPADIDVVTALAAEAPARIVAAVGVHPHEARHLDESCKQRLERAARVPGVVAIGEIGLDYHYDHSPREDQRRALAWQLALARERGLPVVLHQRESWADFLEVLDREPGVLGVAHSFTEGPVGVAAMVARGLLVGISGMVTFPRADTIREAVAAVPSGMLLVETDSPFLAPVPHRGTRNEPANVTIVADAVARIRGVPVEVVERETDSAFARVFGELGDRDGGTSDTLRRHQLS